MTTTTYAGATCSLCGTYILNGYTHSCPTTWSQPQPATQTKIDHTYALLALGNRIADLLERLVTALEERKEDT